MWRWGWWHTIKCWRKWRYWLCRESMCDDVCNRHSWRVVELSWHWRWDNRWHLQLPWRSSHRLARKWRRRVCACGNKHRGRGRRRGGLLRRWRWQRETYWQRLLWRRRRRRRVELREPPHECVRGLGWAGRRGEQRSADSGDSWLWRHRHGRQCRNGWCCKGDRGVGLLLHARSVRVSQLVRVTHAHTALDRELELLFVAFALNGLNRNSFCCP